MGELRLSGLTTGIDTIELVRQLMIVNSRRLATYQVQKVSYENKDSAYDELRTRVSALDSTVAYLSDADDLEIYNATSSDRDILTISASSSAKLGSHSIEINQLATSETWIHDVSSFDYKTDYVGGGNFIYSYNYQERVITTVADETTLEDLVGRINNDGDNPGVTASLLYQAGKYHLMLSGNETGEDYQTSINNENTQVIVAAEELTTDVEGTEAAGTTKITEIYGFSGTIGSGSTDDEISITGQRHDGTAVSASFVVTEYTTIDHLISEINEAFETAGDRTATATLVNGVIRLTDHTSGSSQMQLELAFVPGTDSTAQLSLPTFATILQGDTSYTIASAEATGDDKIIELDQFDYTTLGGSEKITINGTDQDGATITEAELAIDANTTLTNLINQISSAFSNSTASLVDGQILLTDDDSGASSTTITLQFVAGGGSDATFEVPTFSEITGGTDGGTVSASVTSLDPDDFIETQSAQDSKIRVDGYPPQAGGIAEVQTLSKTAKATAGTFTLTYDGQTTGAIAYDATVSDIKDALELLPNVGLDDIGVSGKKLKDDGDTVFTFRNNAGDVSLILIDTTNLVPDDDPENWDLSETTKGDSPDCWLSRNSNSISDALTGITLNLKDVTQTGEPIEITVTRDTTLVQAKIQNMVTAYNALVNVLTEKTEYNDETKKMGILSSDIALSFIKAQMREPFIGVVTGFTEEDTLFQGSDIGITFDGDGKMEFDTNDFNDAIDEDFMAVLELLGATKTGETEEGSTIEFYGASDEYTTAGVYDVEVTITGNVITGAKIKLSTESTYRDATWNDNFVIGDSTFDDGPLYPENSLQLTVDLTTDGVFTGTIRVKQGMAGALEDFLDDILKTDGRLDVAGDNIDYNIEQMENTIEREENRLDQMETRLIARFARLEKTLTLIQQQFAAVSILSIIE